MTALMLLWLPRHQNKMATASTSTAARADRKGAGLRLSLSSRVVRWTLSAIGVLLMLVIWELLVVAAVLPEVDLPRATTVIGELAHQLSSRDFWSATLTTARDAGLGLAIAVAIGVPIGIAMGAFQPIRWALTPTVEFLRPVPGLAWLPLAGVLWGPVKTSVIFLVALGCVFPMIVQTVHGIQSADPQTLLTARAFRLGGLARVRWVYFPSALPHIITGFRLCIGYALIGAVGASLLIGAPGIGTDIRLAQSSLKLPEMYSLVLASGLIGLAGMAIAELIDRLALGWQRAGKVDGK
jgi:ABC-type nitrate/sulfonate/bicarbonate transport system permease component